MPCEFSDHTTEIVGEPEMLEDEALVPYRVERLLYVEQYHARRALLRPVESDVASDS